MTYLLLFAVFFKIGLFSFGGGYAMLPMIFQEVALKRSWVTEQSFTDILAISQITPGPIAINAATYVGIINTGNLTGAVMATMGVSFPSVLIMIILCKYIFKFQENKHLINMFAGLRPIVVGLVVAAAILLFNKENFLDYSSYFIFVGAFALLMYKKVSPIWIIVLSACLGLLIY